ncbi:MAG: gamma-glutamyltransferase, partial [Alphaproteobacteria bacterium]
MKNPDFADTLALVAKGGADAFYTGAIARDIVDATAATSVRKATLTLADMAGYRAKFRPPVCLMYRGYRVCGMGPPTSGGLTVGQILGLLAPFDIPAMGWGAEFAHLFAEAGARAYADRGLYIA